MFVTPFPGSSPFGLIAYILQTFIQHGAFLLVAMRCWFFGLLEWFYLYQISSNTVTFSYHHLVVHHVSMCSTINRTYVRNDHRLTRPFYHRWIVVTPSEKFQLPAAQISRITSTFVFLSIGWFVCTLLVFRVFSFSFHSYTSA